MGLSDKGKKIQGRFLTLVLAMALFGAGCQNTTFADLADAIWGESTTVADTGTTSTVTATPSRPDLHTFSDSGISFVDNITNQTIALRFTGTAEADSSVEI